MVSSTSDNYIVYFLRDYFSIQPGHLHQCPSCGKSISVTDLPPSKKVTDYLEQATYPSHNYTVLYKCTDCHWWAIRESFIDYELSDGQDYLVVCNEKSPTDISQTPNQDASPWTMVLKRKYYSVGTPPLPDTLRRLLLGFST